MLPRIVITHWVHPEIVEFLAHSFEVVPNISRISLPVEEVLRRARTAHAMMLFMPDKIDPSFLDQCPGLRIIAGAFKGYDNVDVKACTDRGIWFTVVRDLLTVPTAELAIALLLALARNVIAGDRLIRGGSFKGWQPILYGSGFSGKTTGIIGMGAVGQAIARRLAGFEMNMIYHDPVPLSEEREKSWLVTRVSLHELLAESDYLVLAVPLTSGTFHLINRGTISAMKKGSCLINVGRGSVVDEEAVAESLESDLLSGYGADVFEFEDLSRHDRPRAIPESLLQHSDKTVFTPHLGSAIDDVRRAVALEAAANIYEALSGKRPEGAVNSLRSRQGNGERHRTRKSSQPSDICRSLLTEP